MNQLLYEGRTLVGMVSSIIRQDALRVPYNRLDWEHMFRLADYHRVANIIYLGVLGKGDVLPDRWRERFFERYQEALSFGENCEESLKEVLTWLDMREISCIVLTSASIRGLYQIPETAENSPVQILLDEEKYSLAKGYLVDLGYETDQVYKGYGERMRKTSGVSVILYQKLPFRIPGYLKSLQRLLETAALENSFTYVRMLSREGEFIFRMARAVYGYITNEVRLREILDLQLFHQSCRDEMDKEAVSKWLEDFQIDELAPKLLRVAYMWFGDRKDSYFLDQPEDMNVFNVLEDRLLTQGEVGQEIDEQALKLEKALQKELDREQRAESRAMFWEKMGEHLSDFKKKLQWIFPDFHYMSSIYPMVEKIPVLLPLFWGIRGLRLLLKIFIK